MNPKIETFTEEAVSLSNWMEESFVEKMDENNQPIIGKYKYITGIFAQSEVINGNNRVYPYEILSEAVDKIQPKILASSAIGEMGHPDTPGLKYERACILTTQLMMEGNNARGKARVLKSVPLGQLLEGLITDGVRIGVSSRGRGSLGNNNRVTKFWFVAPADVVPDPSAPDAFVTAIEEKRDWLVNEQMMTEEVYYGLKQDIIQSKNSKSFDVNKIKILKDFINKFQ